MNHLRLFKRIVSLMVALVIVSGPTPVFAQLTAFTLDQVRLFNDNFNNSSVTLSPLHGDPHPITGVVTPGEYWINGDHIANPTSTHPRFLVLGGTGNTYDFTGTTINLDTRELDGYGRNLGHDSGVDVIRIEGSDNLVKGINLIGQDIALDTDPNAQRYADWSAQYIELSGADNTVDGISVVTRGSRTDSYGLGDAFGKGSAGGITPFIGHRKANAFRVGDATDAVINDMHLDVNTFGHGFFVQASTNTTLTNSTVTGELFPSQGVIDHPLYQQHGHTFHQNEIPDDLLISGNEGGVRMYTGASGLTVDNVVVTNMRTGFATSLGGGTTILNNVEAYGVETAFGIGSNTTVTNAKADGVNGPVVVIDRNIRSNTSVDIELVGTDPINHDYALVYVNGNNIDIDISSDRPAEDFEGTSLIRTAQFYYDNWRETNNTSTFDVSGYDHINSVLINDTNTPLVLGTQAQGNVGRSTGGVISNGKNNDYDGVTLVRGGSRLLLTHVDGLGNNGTETYSGAVTAQTLEDNASVVEAGSTLEIQAGLNIANEKLTISGDGVDGKGALFSDGQSGSGTRFGDSNGGNAGTIFLDGNASIGVGIATNQLLVGRIQGTGNLTKRGAGTLAIEKSSTLNGDLIVAEGSVVARTGVVNDGLTVNSGASIRGLGDMLNTPDGVVQLNGTLDLNDRTDASNLSGTIGLLNGDGQVMSSNATAESGASLELAGNSADGDFTGEIEGDVSLVKSGDNKQTLGGFLSHTGTTTVSGGGLYIDGTHAGGGQYTVNDGGTLGGLGSIQANATLESGAALEPGDADGASQGLLTIGGSYSQAAGAVLGIDIEGTSNHDRLTAWGTTSLAGILDLNSTDPAQYSIGDTLTLLNSFSSVTGQFDSINGVSVGNVDGFGAGLAVQYNAQNVTAQVSIIGDADLDGQVDVLNDAFLLVGNLGTIAGATWTDGDFNGDGAIDVLGDAFALVGNLGANANGSAAANSSAVPEPNAVFLLAAMAMPSLLTRRKS